MQPLLAHMYGPVHAQELLPGRAGMISILFFGTASDVADLVAVLLGYLADHASITFVFQFCLVLPAIGLLTVFPPGNDQLKASSHLLALALFQKNKQCAAVAQHVDQDLFRALLHLCGEIINPSDQFLVH